MYQWPSADEAIMYVRTTQDGFLFPFSFRAKKTHFSISLNAFIFPQLCNIAIMFIYTKERKPLQCNLNMFQKVRQILFLRSQIV